MPKFAEATIENTAALARRPSNGHLRAIPLPQRRVGTFWRDRAASFAGSPSNGTYSTLTTPAIPGETPRSPAFIT